MRILVYLLSLLMIFVPTYSAYASGITKGQIITMGKKGGALVRTGAGVAVKVGKVGRALTPVGAIVWCASNKKCKDKIDDAYEIACDISGVCTAERKEDSDGQCIARFGNDKKTLSQLKSHSFVEDNDYERVEYNADSANFDDVEYHVNNKLENMSTRPSDWSHQLTVQVPYKTKKYNKQYGWHSNSSIVFSYHVYIKCQDTNQLTQDDLNDLVKKITEQMDDDDIKNYYNTDYDDITINNYHYYGDDIDNETNIDNQCQNNSCDEISKEIEESVKNKKYDIDDVNEINCTKSENKYTKCKMDDDDTDNPDNPDDANQDILKKDDDDPLTCDSSKFYKKICDWMDWTQDDLDAQDDGKQVIKDLSKDLEIDDDKIKFGRACPSGPVVNISFAGVAVSHDISYEGLCGAFEKMRPFVIGIGGIVSVMIIGGRRA